MNNKEFISSLASRVGIKHEEAQELSNTLINIMTHELEDGNILSVQGFGTFEVKKKLERIVVNPSSKQRMLVPPKLALSFKPSNALKEKYK